MLAPWKKSYDQPRQHIKKQSHYFVNKRPSSQSCGFSSSHVWLWELEYKESWALRNWCFWTVVLEKTLESPLDSKEIQPVHPNGNQSWIFIGRTDADAEAEARILWSPDVKSWLTGRDPVAGQDWRWEEKGMTEGEIFGWHHWLDGHEFEQALGDGERQRSLECCSPWGHKELDTPERLNNSNHIKLLWLCTLLRLVFYFSNNFDKWHFRYSPPTHTHTHTHTNTQAQGHQLKYGASLIAQW